MGKHIQLKDIKANPHNVRKVTMKSPGMLELVKSIVASDILQPLLVCKSGKGYRVVDGDRRRVAAIEAGLTAVPVFIRGDMTDDEMRVASITANLQREDVGTLDEAAGVKALIKAGLTFDQIGAQLGRTSKWVARRAQIGNLHECWLDAYQKPNSEFRHWTGAHLAVLACLPADTQEELKKKMYSYQWGRMTPSELEDWVASETNLVHKAKWDAADATLVDGAGACTLCTKRSDSQPELFHDPAEDAKALLKGARCLDPKCWEAKGEALVAIKSKELIAKHGDALLVTGKDATSFGTGHMGYYDVQKVKKGTKGAKPCVVASGASAGQVYWGKPAGHVNPAKGKAPGGAKQTSPLKERRESLERKRAKWIATRLIEATQEKELPLKMIKQYDRELLCYLGAFGTMHNYTGRSYLGATDTASSWATLAKLDAEAAAMLLWDEVLAVLRARLEYAIQRLTFDKRAGLKACQQENSQVAEALMLKPGALEAEAQVQLPEPKSWAKLNKDGIPKAQVQLPEPKSWAKLNKDGIPKAPKKKAAKKKAAKKKAANLTKLVGAKLGKTSRRKKGRVDHANAAGVRDRT